MLDSNRPQGEQGDNGFNQPRFNNNQGGYNNNNNQGGGYNAPQQGGYNNAPANNGYGNNNPGGFAPKAPAPVSAPAADLDDDLPF